MAPICAGRKEYVMCDAVMCPSKKYQVLPLLFIRELSFKAGLEEEIRSKWLAERPSRQNTPQEKFLNCSILRHSTVMKATISH
jgi:hypothetical protein